MEINSSEIKQFTSNQVNQEVKAQASEFSSGDESIFVDTENEDVQNATLTQYEFENGLPGFDISIDDVEPTPLPHIEGDKTDKSDDKKVKIDDSTMKQIKDKVKNIFKKIKKNANKTNKTDKSDKTNKKDKTNKTNKKDKTDKSKKTSKQPTGPVDVELKEYFSTRATY